MNNYSEFLTKHSQKMSVEVGLQNLPEIFFQLCFAQDGVFLEVIDSQKREVTEVNHLFYQGKIREVLSKVLEQKSQKQKLFSWSKKEKLKLYLHENSEIFEKLLATKLIIDQKFRRIKLAEGIGEIKLLIEASGQDLKISFILIYEDLVLNSPKMISNSFVLCDEQIFRIKELGSSFHNLADFELILEQNKLQHFLSLAFSSFPNLSVIYANYLTEFQEPVKAKPTIFLKEIDQQKSLKIEIGHSVEGAEANFLENISPTRIVIINAFEHKIIVREIHYDLLAEVFADLTKTLGKYRENNQQKNAFFSNGLELIVEENLAKEFIFNELANFGAKYVIYGTEILKEYRVRTVTPRLKVSFSGNIDYLEGDAEIMIDQEAFSLSTLFNSFGQSNYIKLGDGTTAIINKNYIDKLKRLFKRQKDKVQFSFFDLPIIDELIDEKISGDYFNKSKEVFLGFNNIEEINYPLPKINAVLRNYQLKGYKWLKYLQQNNFGGCLADDMGLGKTVQALTLLRSFYPGQEKKSLIIMPKSLIYNWENEIKKFTPDISYYIFYGENRNIQDAMKEDLILTTYTMIRNELDKFREQSFYFVVLDESQNIKNVNSQISRAVNLIKAEHRFSLSGTPIENNLSELYSLFRFLNPGMFGSLDEFNKNYAIPIQKENSAEISSELRRKIYPFVLRRLKKDVLKELPDKIEQTILIEMSEEQKLFYEQRRSFYYQSIREQISELGIKKSQFYILQAMSDLRQIASIPEAKSENQIISPKREVLIEQIKEVIANDHKVLVFANFLHAIEVIAQDLQKNNIDYLVMTGATRDRQSLVDKFQKDPVHKVFLMTLKTGGIGLNLTAADYVFIFDPWWNKAAENQAIDRSHRIGQEKTVFSYKMITKGTIEEKILKLQERKEELFNNIISSDGVSAKSLDEADVEFILGY